MNIQKVDAGYKTIVRIRGTQGKIVERRVYARTKELLKAEVEKVKAEIRNIPCSLKSAEKFRDVLQFYKDVKGPFCRSHTSLVDLLDKDIGGYPLNDFSERFWRYLSLMKEEKSPAWYNRRIEIINAAFSIAVESEIISRNPINKKVFAQKKETPRDVMLPPDEVAKIVLIAAKNRRTNHIARYLQFLFQIPSRRTEMMEVRIADVDLFNNSVRVRNGTTKTDKGTYKPIPPNMVNWFRRRVSIAKSLDEPVFCRFVRGSRKDRTGNSIKVKPLGDIKNAWNTVRCAAGYPALHLHDSRHISASQLLDNGTPSQVVQVVAGWSSDMLKIYYNRDSKRALSLVKFNDNFGGKTGDCEGVVKETAVQNG